MQRHARHRGQTIRVRHPVSQEFTREFVRGWVRHGHVRQEWSNLENAHLLLVEKITLLEMLRLRILLDAPALEI